MFVPVACTRCGKPFQVPADGLGKPVACPWCRETVPALPVAGEVAAPQPLSLDPDPPPRPPRRPRRLRKALVLLGLCAGAFAATLLVLSYGAGRVPPWAWSTFTAPDGSFRAEFPARPEESEAAALPDFPVTAAGKRYEARTGYSKVTAAVWWVGLDPERLKKMRPEDLAGGVAALRRAELGAVPTATDTVKRGDREGVEFRYATADGVVIDRVVVAAGGPAPRLWVLTYAGRTAGRNDANAARFFATFAPETAENPRGAAGSPRDDWTPPPVSTGR